MSKARLMNTELEKVLPSTSDHREAKKYRDPHETSPLLPEIYPSMEEVFFLKNCACDHCPWWQKVPWSSSHYNVSVNANVIKCGLTGWWGLVPRNMTSALWLILQPCKGRKTSMFSTSSIRMNVKHLNNKRSGYGCKLLKKSHHPFDSHIPLEHELQRAKNLFCTVLSTPLGTVHGMW